jgi:hypothetical protein
VAQFKAVHPETSQRQFAREHDIPRTTLQRWLERESRLSASPEAVAFFESPAGVAFLHCLCVAFHLVLCVMNPCGVRMVSLLLRLSGLGEFIATSYGTQYKLAKVLEEQLARYDDEQRPQLIEKMKLGLSEQGQQRRQIMLLEDETFHPEICLVAIEASSNFVLLERYSERRDANSWNEGVDEALQDLPVEVVAVNADEAKGLKAHIEKGLGAHHLCELFHVQHEITKGCSAPLAAQVHKAQQARDEAQRRHDDVQDAMHDDTTRSVVAQQTLELRRERAANEVDEALVQLQQVGERQEHMREAVRGLSSSYHPYDLQSGAKRAPVQVDEELHECFQKARKVADDANLKKRARKCIEKAARLKTSMVSTVAFFHDLITRRLEMLSVSPDLRLCLSQLLIPLCYLRLAAQRAPSAEARRALLDVVATLSAGLEEHSAWLLLSPTQRHHFEAFAMESAALFVRSDSAVEGRNGQLSRHHHGIHRLSASKLRALTVVHNYFLQRPDGSTAAQRFFGAEPDDLFEWLLKHMPLPPRPAKKRSPRTMRKSA